MKDTEEGRSVKKETTGPTKSFVPGAMVSLAVIIEAIYRLIKREILLHE